MKIIDFKKKGNLVRFYLGDDSQDNWYGDDWNDRPYEHNAGSVYDQFIRGYCDIVFPFSLIVAEPSEDWHNDGNSEWSKDDMKARRVPCIVAVPSDNYWGDREFNGFIADDRAIKFYFGDKMAPRTTIRIWEQEGMEA